jgi:hypothetical protein
MEENPKKKFKPEEEDILNEVKYSGWLDYQNFKKTDNKEFILELVKVEGWVIFYSNFQYDKEIALEAIKNNPIILADLPHFQNDKEFIIKAVKNNLYCLLYASDELQLDLDVILASTHMWWNILKPRIKILAQINFYYR